MLEQKRLFITNKLFIVIFLVSYIYLLIAILMVQSDEKTFVKRPNEVYITIWDRLSDASFFWCEKCPWLWQWRFTYVENNHFWFYNIFLLLFIYLCLCTKYHHKRISWIDKPPINKLHFHILQIDPKKICTITFTQKIIGPLTVKSLREIMLGGKQTFYNYSLVIYICNFYFYGCVRSATYEM